MEPANREPLKPVEEVHNHPVVEPPLETSELPPQLEDLAEPERDTELHGPSSEREPRVLVADRKPETWLLAAHEEREAVLLRTDEERKPPRL